MVLHKIAMAGTNKSLQAWGRGKEQLIGRREGKRREKEERHHVTVFTHCGTLVRVRSPQPFFSVLKTSTGE